jgi:uncharacterized protein
MIKNNIVTDTKYNGLPAIWFNKNYIVYSPYIREFVCLKKHQIRDANVREELNQIGFFSKPKKDASNNKTRESKIIVLSVTKKCNLNCTYCFADSSSAANSLMSPLVAANIIKYVSERAKLKAIHFIGGEPTINFGAIRSVKEKADELDLHPSYYITTNGIAPNPIINWLIENGFIIKISWDGLFHSKTRLFSNGQDSSALVERTIALLAEKACKFCIRMTVTKSNLPFILKSIQKCIEIGAKYFQIEPMSPDGRGSNIQYEIPDPEDFVKLFSKAITLADKKGFWLINSALANLFEPKDYFCCSFKDQIYHFGPDGTISGCYKVMNKDDSITDKFIIGNYTVRDNQVRFDIDPRLSQRLADLSNRNYASCYNCSLRFICSGGCPLRNIKSNHKGGDIDQWTCQIRRGILRIAILHIYKRSLARKGTCLEGNIRFYNFTN